MQIAQSHASFFLTGKIKQPKIWKLAKQHNPPMFSNIDLVNNGQWEII